MTEREIKNKEVLHELESKELNIMGYGFIPDVMRRTRYYKLDEIVVAGNCLMVLHLHHQTILSFSWSYNEPKIYFNAGPFMIRLCGTRESLEAALNAIELMRPLFNEMVKYHEL